MNFELLEMLKNKGVELSEGLNQYELNKINEVFGIEFPKELMDFYCVALPISDKFYNWRDFSIKNIEKIKYALDKPYNDVYNLADEIYWCEDWGMEPDREGKARFIRHKLKSAPKLIPIFSHRYVPMIDKDNLPVFSVCNTDVIYYGENLELYFEIEFGDRKQSEINFARIESVPFWNELL